ncbi:hypothetical protein AMJ52_03355 [candidate division TA06 bacterium DG_78]|uniref:Bacterial surface antigen (D15) domain-containing protein n=1 Tax=candidate division TA06 bacterium DG_78 TaxID=1703772 RepID=A0A0S7YGV5_UNCT6|nr:MAG: hypothetical protein AMJ52_03355 [candidate division TA06 bacterium DG_78]
MKKIYITICLCLFTLLNFAGANDTRMGILMTGDYIDDIVNIRTYPHHISLYHNSLYGDIASDVEDYGIIITPDIKYGAIAFWQDRETQGVFNLGYGLDLFNFNIGAFGSLVEDHTKFGVGFGRSFFTRRFDCSFIIHSESNYEQYQFNLRYSERKSDFIIVPKYQLNYYAEPFEYSNHILGLLIQRLVFSEGFVFFIAEYDFSRGDIENDYTNVYTGFELPLSKILILRLGVSERFTNGLESPTWYVEPGIGLQIRGFSIDFHVNKDWLFDRDEDENVGLIKSFGLDLNFGRF